MAQYGTSNQRTTPIVLNLIIINALVYIAQMILDKTVGLTNYLALYSVHSEYFKPYQLVTHMFAHSPATFFHILFNMYALWMFGTVLERVWGAKKFLIFYLVCGLAAGVAQMFAMDINGSAVGASGAIMGESERYIGYRKRKISMGADGNALMILISINAIFFIAVWFLQIVYYIIQSAPGSFENNILPWFIMPAKLSALVQKPWTVFTYM